MKQLCLKVSLLLFFVTHLILVYGQGNLVVHDLNGGNQKHLVSTIDKLTFPGENMLVTLKSSSSKNYSIPEIKFCNFKENSGWGNGRPTYSVLIFPNPTDNKFSIESTIEISEVILYDILGQKLMQVIPDSKTIPLQLSNFARGVYVLQIMTPEGVMSAKIIKD